MNSITIEFEDTSCKKSITVKEARDFINKVLNEIKTDNVELSVSFIDIDRMHELNRTYRNIDAPTDILSFAAMEDVDGFSFVSAGRRKKNIGDILICPQVMRENAKTFNVSSEEELHRLLIHGVLHLTGEDHKTNDATEPMLVKQEEILKKLT